MTMYAQLNSAQSVLLAFENGKTVEYAVDDQFVVLAEAPTADQIEANLAAGHTYRAVHIPR